MHTYVKKKKKKDMSRCHFNFLFFFFFLLTYPNIIKKLNNPKVGRSSGSGYSVKQSFGSIL